MKRFVYYQHAADTRFQVKLRVNSGVLGDRLMNVTLYALYSVDASSCVLTDLLRSPRMKHTSVMVECE